MTDDPQPAGSPAVGCALGLDATGAVIVFGLLPLCGVDVPLWVKIAVSGAMGALVLAALFLSAPWRADDTDEQRKG